MIHSYLKHDAVYCYWVWPQATSQHISIHQELRFQELAIHVNKEKRLFCLCQSTVPTRHTRDKAPFILKFNATWREAVIFILRPPYPQRELTLYQIVTAHETLATAPIALMNEQSWLTLKGMTSWHVMYSFLLRHLQRILILNMGS